MKEITIKENHLYRKTFRRGKRQTGQYTTVFVLKDLSAHRLKKAHPQKQYVNRIGLSVPKREGGAIERNRVKRIIREGLRGVEKRHPLRRGFLIVIASRPGIEAVNSPVIESELYRLFRKLDLFERPESPQAVPDPKHPPQDGRSS